MFGALHLRVVQQYSQPREGKRASEVELRITKEKLIELKTQVADNMADAEVGPLLDEIARLRRYVEGDAQCPCCMGTIECDSECTFASDCPIEAERMDNARTFLNSEGIQ